MKDRIDWASALLARVRWYREKCLVDILYPNVQVYPQTMLIVAI